MSSPPPEHGRALLDAGPPALGVLVQLPRRDPLPPGQLDHRCSSFHTLAGLTGSVSTSRPGAPRGPPAARAWARGGPPPPPPPPPGGFAGGCETSPMPRSAP